MAHQEQKDFFNLVKNEFPEYFVDTLVLDVGSLDINGNNSHLFESCLYVGVDVADGVNVDIVSKGHEVDLPSKCLDVVISSECFEHDMHYSETLKNMYRMLKPGGLFTFTCATLGRPEHGTARTTPHDAPLLQNFDDWSNYYLNLTEDDIRKVLNVDELFKKYVFQINHKTHDLYFYGIKNGDWIRSNLHKPMKYLICKQSEQSQRLVVAEKESGKLYDDLEKIKGQYALLAEDFSSLRKELEAVYRSKSWLVTRPFRLFRRLITGKVPIRKILRPLYKISPRLLSVRIALENTYQRVFSSSVLSSQNMPAFNALTANRFSSLPKNDSILNNLPVDDLPHIDMTVVTFNNGRWLDSFMTSLLAQSYPLSKINLFFNDNGSSDETVGMIEEMKCLHGLKFSSFNVFQSGNVGFGAGHDVCIRHGKSHFFLVCNVDIEFEEKALVNIVNAALKDSENVASWEMRQIPYEHPKYYDPVTLETNWSSHACILIRRSAYFEVGGYDSKIFMYCEDVELSYRFRLHGYLLKYCPRAVVVHHTYEDLTQIKKLQYAGSILGNGYLRLRYGTWKDKLALLPMYVGLLARREPFSGARKLVWRNVGQTIKNFGHFFKLQKKANVFFPFRGFDYDMIREGAFYQVKPPIQKGPLVSVITRTYAGRGMFLKQSIESVMNQTYSNIELIIVEDGGETLKEFVEGMPMGATKISYYSQPKVGRSATGNYGLSVSKGEYLMFLDDDDLLFSDHVEVLMNLLLEEDVLAAYSLSTEVSTRVVEGNQSYIEEGVYTHKVLAQEFDYEILLDHNYITIQSILFHRSCYDARGGFDEKLDMLEDWNLWLRYAYKNKFKYVDKVTSLYRVPSDAKQKIERAQMLHAAYEIALQNAKTACKSYHALKR
ncbi:glycosyltransferase [Hydromonas duriensis]|uniref:GT2 family glycosyltransferase n=1 Tax=Hydromonas duriensis TaxID=1527608 RepID=A0A4R6Y858_9BURK|nr:glycosyltransferase [Hydromonas duriensis]TDR31570.1 GT2 family glycosyltransferase [Hydromonas duriensis]